MSADIDPFSYHPELRGKIADPLQSFFRTFTTAFLVEQAHEFGLPLDWWYSDEEREALRARTMAAHGDTDLWVFAYGSLMWDPAFRFTEVRRAQVPDYARRYILKDIYGWRGTAEAPGLMAALDKGNGCEGLLFRIAHQNIDEETDVIWRREVVAPGYIPTFVDAIASGQRITALTFVANHEVELIDASLTREEQIQYFATGTGFLGSSLEYLMNIDHHFAALGIADDDTSAMLRDTKAYLKTC